MQKFLEILKYLCIGLVIVLLVGFVGSIFKKSVEEEPEDTTDIPPIVEDNEPEPEPEPEPEFAEVAINSFSVFGRHAAKGNPNVAFYVSFRATNAFDGDITSDAQTKNHNRDGHTIKPYEMCYFDADGAMVYGENPDAEGKSYKLMFIIELEDYAAVDTLDLWTPYIGTNDAVYMANNGYDIYYSVDGESYAAVDGASFENVYEKQSTADALYVEGTYNGKDGHVHAIDMDGVTAKYIAIAVSDVLYNGYEAIVSEAVVNGATVPTPDPEPDPDPTPDPDPDPDPNPGDDNTGDNNFADDPFDDGYTS